MSGLRVGDGWVQGMEMGMSLGACLGWDWVWVMTKEDCLEGEGEGVEGMSIYETRL